MAEDPRDPTGGVLLLASGRMFGGGQRVVLDILRGMEGRSGPRVRLCLLGGPPRGMEDAASAVLEYDGRYDDPRSLVTTARRLRRVLEERAPSLVHSHGWDASALAAMALGRRRTPHLVHLHTSDGWLTSGSVRHRVRRMITRWMLSRPGTVAAAVSESVRRHWLGSLGLPLERGRVIPNGVDTARFLPRTTPRDGGESPVLGSVFRLWRNKGWEPLLGALGRLAEEGLRPSLAVAGDGPDGEAIMEEAAARGVGGQVRLHGFVEGMESFYAGVDIGVLASLSEGMPLTVLESMACGLPVVATRVGGTGEVLRDGVDGFLVPPGDARALADALRRLCRDPALRRAMGRAGRERVEASFSREAFLDSVAGVYGGMAASPGGSHGS